MDDKNLDLLKKFNLIKDYNFLTRSRLEIVFNNDVVLIIDVREGYGGDVYIGTELE